MTANSLTTEPTSQTSFLAGAEGLTRADHDRILSTLTPPLFLIGDGSLLDDVWPLRPDSLRGKASIDFRVPIAPKSVLLTNPANIHDLVTAKLFLYYSFSSKPEGWTSSAKGLKRSWIALLYVIRWRAWQGLPRMADLTRPWFNLFLEQVRTGGRWGLLPHEERIKAYLAEIEAGREALPIVGKGRRKLAVNEVARRLGVSVRLQLPGAAWRSILDYLAEVDPIAYRNTVRHQGTDAASELESEHDEGNGLTVSQVAEILHPFEKLWVLRDRLAHDPIGVRAFDHESTCARTAEAIASQALERTRLPPDPQVCWLVDASLRLVLTCEPHLRRMQEVVDEAFCRYPRDASANYTTRQTASTLRVAYCRRHLPPLLLALENSMNWHEGDSPSFLPIYTWRQMKVGSSKEGVDVRDLLFVLLPAACAVVITALTARRRTEIAGLRHDCLIFDEYGDPFLSVWIQKTLRRLDKIPVPMSVVQAVKVLLRLSADARTVHDTPWLFSFKDPGLKGENVGFDMSEALKSLAAFVRVPPLPDGSYWDFRPHQFRVFFGIVYFWRFDYPSLTALSDFYKHFNPTMTQAYVTRIVQGSLLRLLDEKNSLRKLRKAHTQDEDDESIKALQFAHDRSRDFRECQETFLMEVARGAITGEAPLSGWGGEAWTRELEALIDKISSDIHLVPIRGGGTTLDSVLREWVKDKHIDPHPVGHGFCKCGHDRSDLAAAACLKAKKEYEGEAFDATATTAPDYTYAADETCSGCPHNIQRRGANERYWQANLAEAENAAEKAATHEQRERARGRADRLREHIGRCFGDRGE